MCHPRDYRTVEREPTTEEEPIAEEGSAEDGKERVRPGMFTRAASLFASPAASTKRKRARRGGTGDDPDRGEDERRDPVVAER